MKNNNNNLNRKLKYIREKNNLRLGKRPFTVFGKISNELFDDEYIRAGEIGIYTKDEKGKYFLLRKEMLTIEPYLKQKNKNFPKIIFVCLVIKLIILVMAIIKISEL